MIIVKKLLGKYKLEQRIEKLTNSVFRLRGENSKLRNKLQKSKQLNQRYKEKCKALRKDLYYMKNPQKTNFDSFMNSIKKPIAKPPKIQ